MAAILGSLLTSVTIDPFLWVVVKIHPAPLEGCNELLLRYTKRVVKCVDDSNNYAGDGEIEHNALGM